MTLDELVKAQQEREILNRQPERVAEITARMRLALNSMREDAVHEAHKAFLDSPQRPQKVIQLRKLSDAYMEPAMAVSPCKKGCSLCCYQSVSVNRAEAELIARETGLKLNARPLDLQTYKRVERNGGKITMDFRTRYRGVRCAFLKRDDTCGIYSSRPMACRTLVNLDEDNLQCYVTPDYSAEVLYFDASAVNDLYIEIAGVESSASDIADLRDWFPEGLKGVRKNGH